MIPGPNWHPDWRQVSSDAVSQHGAIQHSAELAMLLALAESAEVRTVLEIGTFAGGTAWAFSHLPSVERIITIDYGPQDSAEARLAALGNWVTMIRGNSADPDTRHEVIRQLAGSPPDLLFIDGSHDLESVTIDWQVFGPMVRPGGLVAFHDVEVHQGRPEVEVHELWKRVRSAYPSVKVTAAPGEWAGIGIIWR